ncbi:chemotaxis protein CheA [Pseudodesulfovibrio sp. JC047]|uniref:chemotaxis protein CheA n=1 Tax=Pseudodesulfovibrio sp. JC047 TaxID=2683199 RepID=UPI0013D8B172|nr:chemotaxis protein CheA [Pseudodesulfovibrio sp. JC047]NDV19757.1 chemotaxis protein CheA [Pseudodesulfovibrio sp. JC047]
MSDDLNRQIFKEEAYDLLRELEGALLELEEAPNDMDLVNQIFRALHTIKGSGSMFGFDEIAGFTHEVETVFDMVRNGDLPVSPALCSLSLQARDHIKNMLDADDAGSVDAENMETIFLGLKELVQGENEEQGGEEAESSEIEPTGDEQSDQSLHAFHISLKPQGDADLDVEAVELFFEELDRLGELSVLSRHRDTGTGWELHLVTAEATDAVEDVFFFLTANVSVDIHPAGATEPVPTPSTQPVDASKPESEANDSKSSVEIAGVPDEECIPKIGEILVQNGDLCEEDVHAALKKQEKATKPLGQILAEDGKVTQKAVKKAVKRQGEVKDQVAHKKRQEVMSSIRVAADKLDYLVDLVGELVIVQAQISQVISERNDPTMTILAEELERLSDELRDSTLGIRMLPIGTSFSKFRRLVRDLSADLGKQIGLSTSGAETELDKTVIERLSDPLVHLLRNSIDHGIESPEERVAQGKPAQGTIMLAAEHSGGEVLIRITDDGKGMRSEVIRKKGVERGLISRDAELTEKELLKLIFEPGFSTASEVTSVSGRGVGMDVVKRAIDSLRGTIDIDSKPGTGTTITIRLPLTLAIIDGLQVKVENEFYVIPLSLVEECVELTREQVNESDSGQRILHLRGEIVPYIHIRDWFEVEGDSPPIEQIVITGVEGSRVGIVVDTVIGEHQTVIKSLGRVYKDVEGISGATIKGDGSIALILDVPGLVRRVVAESK